MENRGGRYLEEREAEFVDNAGYLVKVTIEPTRSTTRLLYFLGLKKPQHVSLEIYDYQKDSTEFVVLSETKEKGLYNGIFETRKGTKLVRVIMDSNFDDGWKAEIYIERLFS